MHEMDPPLSRGSCSDPARSPAPPAPPAAAPGGALSTSLRRPAVYGAL